MYLASVKKEYFHIGHEARACILLSDGLLYRSDAERGGKVEWYRTEAGTPSRVVGSTPLART